MPTEQISPALEALADDVATRMEDPPPARTIKLWQRLGLVPAPIIIRRGNQGTASDYPPGTVDAVLRTAQQVAQHGNVDAVVLGRFGAGEPSLDTAVKRAYRRRITAQESIAARLRTAPPKPTARKVASEIGKQSPELLASWNERARAQVVEEQALDKGIDKRFKLKSKPTTFADVREGDVSDYLAARTGSSAANPVAIFGLDETAEDAIEHFGGMPSFTQCRQALDAASWEELCEQRDEISPMIGEILRGTHDDVEAAELVKRTVLAAFVAQDPIALGLVVVDPTLTMLAIKYRSAHPSTKQQRALTETRVRVRGARRAK